MHYHRVTSTPKTLWKLALNYLTEFRLNFNKNEVFFVRLKFSYTFHQSRKMSFRDFRISNQSSTMQATVVQPIISDEPQSADKHMLQNTTVNPDSDKVRVSEQVF